MSRLPPPSWLWRNDFLWDVKVELRTALTMAVDTLVSEPAIVAADSGGITLRTTQSQAQADEDGAGAVARSGVKEDDIRAAKRPRQDTSSSPPSGHTCSACPAARTYRLHALVLTTCSEYFRTRLFTGNPDGEGCGTALVQYTDGQSDDAGSIDGPPIRRQCIVEYVEERELDAMEALLRYCYSGELHTAGGDNDGLCCHSLLCMIVLADRFDVPSCLAHCLEELSRRPPAAYDIAAINAALALPPSAQQHSSSAVAAVRSNVVQQLLHLFGDADAVCGSWYQPAADSSAVTPQALLRQLSCEALVLLLQSDQLKCSCENSVLLMADAWACGGAADVHQRTPSQLRQVAECVRLSQLSHPFAFDVLPQLSWLQMSVGETASVLRHFALGSAAWDLMRSGGGLEGPTTWFLSEPRPEGVTLDVDGLFEINWAISSDVLKVALRVCTRTTEHLLCSAQYFNRGFTVSLFLDAELDSGAMPHVGYRLQILRGGDRERALPHKGVYHEASFYVQLNEGTSSASLMSTGWNPTHMELRLAGDASSAAAKRRIDSWATCLHDGVFTVRFDLDLLASPE